MHFVASSLVMCLLLAISLLGGTTTGGPDNESGDETQVRPLLEEGRAMKSLPAGLVIRLEAHLSRRMPADQAVRAKQEAHGVDFSKVLDEIWEFSGDRVHRVTRVANETGGERVYRRVESAPFDGRVICQELLNAKILALAARQGDGNDNFAGTGFDQGEHSIELMVNGKTILSVGETCLEPGFAEQDARAFARLYEKLVVGARKVFALRSTKGERLP